jgi:hypothetical protein
MREVFRDIALDITTSPRTRVFYSFGDRFKTVASPMPNDKGWMVTISRNPYSDDRPNRAELRKVLQDIGVASYVNFPEELLEGLPLHLGVARFLVMRARFM